MTHVRVSRYVRCPFSAALEFSEKAVNRQSEFYLTPAPPLGERAAFSAKSTTDSTDCARKHDALLIAWRPRNSAFPEFRGVLTARPYHRGAMLRLTGQYQAPFGLSGRLFDFIIGCSIARRTLRHLLEELALDIEAQYREECKRADSTQEPALR